MKIIIAEGVTLEASRKTCERVTEAMKLLHHLDNLSSEMFDDWYEYQFEVEYCLTRADLLLGLMAEDERTIECYGKI